MRASIAMITNGPGSCQILQRRSLSRKLIDRVLFPLLGRGGHGPCVLVLGWSAALGAVLAQGEGRTVGVPLGLLG